MASFASSPKRKLKTVDIDESQTKKLEKKLNESVKEYCQLWTRMSSLIMFVWAYVVSQTKRTPRAFLIGCTTVLIIVAFIAVLFNTIGHTALVFLKLSETTVGENDLISYTDGMTLQWTDSITNETQIYDLPLLTNFTKIVSKYDLPHSVKGATPRWILPINITFSTDNGNSTENATINDSNITTPVLALMINSTNEANMDLSRNWKYKPLSNDHCYITRSVMRSLGYSTEESIIGQRIEFPIMDIFNYFNLAMFDSTNLPFDESMLSLIDSENDDSSMITLFMISLLMISASGIDLYPSFAYQPTITNPPLNENCYTGVGKEFIGYKSVSQSGIGCQSWLSDNPHSIPTDITDDATNIGNDVGRAFCRNPNNAINISTTPYCYTNDINTEKERCYISHCYQNYRYCEALTVEYNVSNGQIYYLRPQSIDESIVSDVSDGISDLLNISVQSEIDQFVSDWRQNYAFACPKQLIRQINFGAISHHSTLSGDCNSGFWMDDQSSCQFNIQSIIDSECVGKQQCTLNMNEYFQNDEFMDCLNSKLTENNVASDNVTFITQVLCDRPHEWSDRIYMNETVINATLFVLSQQPNIGSSEIHTFANYSALVSGQTLTIDELRWMAVLSLLGNVEMTDFVKHFTIADIISSPDGKWSDQLGSVMVLESDWIQSWIRDNLGTDIAEITEAIIAANHFITNVDWTLNATKLEMSVNETRDYIRNDSDSSISYLEQFRINDFAQFIIFNYRQRIELYQSEYKKIQNKILEFGGDITETLEPNWLSATVTAPLVTMMLFFWFIRLLLESVMTSMTNIIAILSFVVIYSLMITDVQSKTYECGVLRSLGMKKTTLINILGFKAMFFAVPGIIIGIGIAHLLNIPIAIQIFNYASVDPQYILETHSMIFAAIFGLFIPILSSVIPMRRSLSTSLRDALDLYRNAVDDIIISVQKLESVGFNLSNTILAVILVLVGFVSLYLIPYSAVNQNFQLFLSIFQYIFLGMLLGLALIASIIQPLINRFICWVTLSWGPQQKIQTMVKKNLHGHFERNQKTSVMVTISTAFIVFCGCMLELQKQNILDVFVVSAGADIAITSTSIKHTLPESKWRSMLTNDTFLRSKIINYTFVTFGMNQLDDISTAQIGSLSGVAKVKNPLVGVEQHFCDVAYCDKYLVMTDIDSKHFYSNNSEEYPRTEGGTLDPIAALYLNTNAQNRLTVATTNYVPPTAINSGHWSKRSKRNKQQTYESEMQSFYDNPINVITAQSLVDASGMNLNIPARVFARYGADAEDGSVGAGGIAIDDDEDESPTIRRYGVVEAFVSKVPGFYFSSYSSLSSAMNALITMDQYLETVTEAYTALYGSDLSRHVNVSSFVPKQTLLIRVSNDATLADRTDIIDILIADLNTDYITTVDTIDTIDTLTNATQLLLYFFQFVAILTMILCFFIAWISFRQNITENVYQFAVLRSIGFSAINVLSMFITEALVIVSSSLFLGTLIGITQSIALTLQSQILTENVFQFIFPTQLFSTLVGAALIIAISASLLPSYHLMKTPPALLLRG